MKERPILFSAPMVRAILAGRKTQTRRIAKPQPDSYLTSLAHFQGKPTCTFAMKEGVYQIACPYGRPGDRLWVKETWGYPLSACKPTEIPEGDPIIYRADYPDDGSPGYKQRPSIFMRRWMSRITTKIVSIRIERLNDISEDEAWAEGIGEHGKPLAALFNVLLSYPKVDLGALALSMPRDFAFGDNPKVPSDRERVTWVTARGVYAALWEGINGPGSWAENPWVWVVEFRRVGGRME